MASSISATTTARKVSCCTGLFSMMDTICTSPLKVAPMRSAKMAMMKAKPAIRMYWPRPAVWRRRCHSIQHASPDCAANSSPATTTRGAALWCINSAVTNVISSMGPHSQAWCSGRCWKRATPRANSANISASKVLPSTTDNQSLTCPRNANSTYATPCATSPATHNRSTLVRPCEATANAAASTRLTRMISANSVAIFRPTATPTVQL